MNSHDTIAVIDFGGQYAHLIATKVRRLRVLAEIRQPEDPIEAFQHYKGLILSGSPSLSAFGEDSAYTKAIYDLDIPILGFCFGHQEIAKHYGGTVVHGGREWGHARLHLVRPHPLFAGLSAVEQVWMSHFDSVTSVGADFEELGYTLLGESEGIGHRFAAIGSDTLRRYGFQYHPEVDDTVHGDEMIAQLRPRHLRLPPVVDDGAVPRGAGGTRAAAGGRPIGLSARVRAAWIRRSPRNCFGQAIGSERLHLLHVDNGLMRKDESREVLTLLQQLGLGQNLHFVDATADFLGALAGVVEPERKRQIIGDTFVERLRTRGAPLGIEGHLLGQGTIYPDTIETGGTKRADTIKTHHNRVPIIEEMIADGKVIEPLAELYKVEVRELGERLGIPHDVIWRHPFPGPGLGVRLLCSAGVEDCEGFDRIEPAVREAACRYGLASLVLPIRSVGVKADLRAYEHPVLLGGDADWERLLEAAGMIFKEVAGINRCIWNLGPRMPSRARPLAATVTARPPRTPARGRRPRDGRAPPARPVP